MTDRELMELAAKAAGVKGQFCEFGIFQDGTEVHDSEQKIFWNPLTDDGDALRLAVKLHIEITFRPYAIEAKYPFEDVKKFIKWKVLVESVFADYYSATRRAIVRAAAEIGKEMP